MIQYFFINSITCFSPLKNKNSCLLILCLKNKQTGYWMSVVHILKSYCYLPTLEFQVNTVKNKKDLFACPPDNTVSDKN